MIRSTRTLRRSRLALLFADHWRDWAIACAIALLLSACGGGGSGTSDGPGPAPAPGDLTLVSSTPPDGATGVDRGVQPQLTFSAAVDPDIVSMSNPLGPVRAAVTARDEDVTVTPARRLLPATTYEVQVSNGPTVSFTTRDGAWAAAATRISSGVVDVGAPDIAVDPDGNAIAVWAQYEGTQRNIWASRYERGTGWSAPFLIEHNAALADSPRVAMDAQGNAIAVWIQVHVGAPSVWASRFTPAGGWEAPEPLEDMDGTAAVSPRIGMNAAGEAVVAWYQVEAVANIYVNRYVPGSGWQGPESVEANTLAAFEPDVVVTPSGTTVVAWRQRNAGNLFDLMATTAPRGGGWSTPVLVETAAGDLGAFHLAAAADGTVVASWNQIDGQHQCWASFFRAGSGWETAQRIDASAMPCHDARAATDARGGVHFTWAQQIGPASAVWSRSVRGGSWSAPEQVSAGTEEALDPAIASDAMGNLLLVWQQDRGDGNYPAHAARRVAGAAWGTPVRLDPGTDTSVAAYPVLAMDASGSAFAFWAQYDAAAAVVNGVVNHFD